jgi:hypothetical protein
MSGQTTLFRYHGRSMWPCFQEGDLLEISSMAAGDIRSGDCIAFRGDNGRTVAHRVVSAHGSMITRGDALPVIDEETILPEHVLGKVVRICRLGRAIKVRGGIVGRFAGCFYRYAGRIDPQRASRGGKLAKSIRTVSTAVLGILNYKCISRSMTLADERKITVWELKGKIIGRQLTQGSERHLAWPWSVFVEEPKD